MIEQNEQNRHFLRSDGRSSQAWSHIVFRLYYENIKPQNHLSFRNLENLNPLNYQPLRYMQLKTKASKNRNV